MASGGRFRERVVLFQDPRTGSLWRDEAWNALKRNVLPDLESFGLNGELAMSEFWDLERDVIGMVVDSFRWLVVVFVRFVAVGGLADSVSGSHIHCS
jgi:hypothetical protein